MFNKIKKIKFVSGLINESQKILWKIEIEQFAVRKLIMDKSPDIEYENKKIKELENYIEGEEPNSRKMREILEEKEKIEENIKKKNEEKEALEYKLGQLVESYTDQKWYIDYILKKFRKSIIKK